MQEGLDLGARYRVSSLKTKNGSLNTKMPRDPLSVNRCLKVVRGEWNRVYIEELRQFPRGKNDDMVDGSSLAFNNSTARSLGFQYLEFEWGLIGPFIIEWKGVKPTLNKLLRKGGRKSLS